MENAQPDGEQNLQDAAEETNENVRRATVVSENRQSIDWKLVNLKEIVQNDILEANTVTQNMVDAAKANIANLVNFCNKDTSQPLPTFETITHSGTEEMIRRGIHQAKRKAQTDLNVVRLYDKSLANEIQDHIKKDVIDKSLTTIKKKTKLDFRNTQENTENMIMDTKSTVENFINTISENEAEEEGNESPGNELLQKMKNKATRDFKKSNEKAQKLSSKTTHKIHENMNIIFPNPTGTKSPEEIESEQFVKENIIEFSEKVQEDIIREKINFSRAVDEARGNVGLNLLTRKNTEQDQELETNRARVIRFYDKTKETFKEVNEKLQDDVVTLKEQIDLPKDVAVSGNESVPDILNKFPETAQADFKDTDAKLKEDVKGLKSKITQKISRKDDPEAFEKQKEVSKVIENSLNEFQDMAKNDFQETNEKVMDDVNVAKSKIDKSVNKLKENLFFKGP